MTPLHLQCDAPGCTLKFIMIDHGEKYCCRHALEKMLQRERQAMQIAKAKGVQNVQ